MTEAQPQVNNGQDRGVLHAMGDEETLVGQPAGRTAKATAKLNGAGQVTDEDPTLPPKDHNGAPKEGEIDARAKPVNDMFAKIDRHEATSKKIEAQRVTLAKQDAAHRITVGKMLTALRAEIEAEAPPYVARQGHQKAQHLARHWNAWCKANIKRSIADINRVMNIAGADDPHAALEKERVLTRTHNAYVRQTSGLKGKVREAFADGKPHKVAFIAEKLGVPVEELIGPSKVLQQMATRPTQFTELTTISPDRKTVTITPVSATVPISEIEAKMRPFIEELKDWGRKTQIQISPHDILVAAERLEECIDLWAGRPSKFEKRKAERLARMHK